MAERWEAVDERTENDNFHTSIYETGHKGLLVARCNQNGTYPEHGEIIIKALDLANVIPLTLSRPHRGGTDE